MARRGARRAAVVQIDAGLHQWACFLAEQSAQLIVKALLHGLGAQAWGHNLVHLLEAIAGESGSALPGPVLASGRRLSRFYIPTRYPDAHSGGAPGTFFGPEDSQQALTDLDIVLRFVDSLYDEIRED